MATRWNKTLSDGQSAAFIKRTDIPHNAALLNSLFLNLDGIRGYWNMASRDQNAAVYDMSGQGRALTNTGAVTFGSDLVTPYAILSGANSLQRPDEAGLDITTAMTVIAIVKFTNTASAIETIISKYGAAGQRSFRVVRGATGLINFSISSNGTATFSIAGTYTIPAGKWVMVVGRFTPSTSIDVWSIPFDVNGVDIDDYKTTNTTTIPATIFNSTSFLGIGTNAIPSQLMTGSVMYSGYYSVALPDHIVFSLYELAKPVTGA